MPSQLISDREGIVEEASSSPPPKSAPQQRVQTQQRTQTTTYYNPCCCNCTLTESVIWIAALEIIWNLINLLVQMSLYVTSKDAYKKVVGGGTVTPEELLSSKFYNDYSTSMVIAMILFGIGVGLAILLMVTVAWRLRALCYVWMGGIFLVAVGHIINIIMHTYSRSYQTLFWIPLLIYFGVVVAAYANEILIYPEGPPIVVHPVVNVMNQGPAVVYGQPVVYGGYGGGYGYGYPPGYGYGYHAGDAAVAGLALGMGAGMMMGGCDYGYGGCGFYDDCMMF